MGDHNNDAQASLDRCKCLTGELEGQLEEAPDAWKSMVGLVMYRVKGLMVESVMKLLALDTDGVQALRGVMAEALSGMREYAMQHTAQTDLMHLPLVCTLQMLCKNGVNYCELPRAKVLTDQKQRIVDAHKSLFCAKCGKKHKCS